MRALVFEGPGRLAVRDVPEPRPAEAEVLVRVRYSGICGTDLHVVEGMPGIDGPVIIGHEVVGEVAAAAHGFAVGERVAVEPLRSCLRCRACREGNRHVCRELRVMGVHVDGGTAEYKAVPAHLLHRLPAGLSWEQAACTEPTSVAVHMVRRAGVQLGDTVLVIGGGPIGYLVAAAARAAGAAQVLISELSSPRREFCREAGFEVIDPSEADLLATIRARTDGEGADVVVEAVGHHSTSVVMIEAARVRGTVLVGGLYPAPPPTELRLVTMKELTLVGSRVYEARDIRAALDLLASGRIDVSHLVTSVVPLERAIEDGFGVLERSRSEMKVVIAPAARVRS